MDKLQNMESAHRWFEEIWSQGRLETADELVSSDYAPEWIQIEATGPAQVKHEVHYFRSIFPDLKYEIVDAVPLPDRVWVRYRGRGTHEGNAWGFEPTGKEVTYAGVTILYFNEQGKIVDRWGAFCFYDIFADLELVPPFWELSQRLGSS